MKIQIKTQIQIKKKTNNNSEIMNTDMNQETLDRLRDLKLYGMYNTFKSSLDNYNNRA